ncbi:HutD family protein [Streptomyces sp. NPDC007100]|uniref:HutD/Ves family protein n=1 Tax=Streptomyces sp. NPDC007100 TaxID=3155602 RepID=UPI0033DC519C
MRVLRAAGRTASAWSNGGGVTREVAAAPSGAGWDAFDWRVSLAEVGRDGPYSALPGVDRVLTVADGAGLELTVDGTRHELHGRYHPFAFPGDAETGCRLLDGPVVNFNVMLRRGRSAATVEMARGDYAYTAPPPTAPTAPGGQRSRLVVALSGPATLDAEGPAPASPLPLERYDAVLLPDAAGFALRTDGVVAVVTLTRAPSGGPCPGRRAGER